MKTISMHPPDRNGAALVSVLCMMLLLSALMAAMVMVTGSHMKMARFQVDSEQAFYVAEAGVERSAQCVANGSNVPASFFGTVGDGAYVATVIRGATVTDAWHSVGGQININPNNSPDNEFVLTLPDGSQVTRDNLDQDYPGYLGSARIVHVRPKGGGTQNELMVDGVATNLDNNKTYDVVSDYMSVSLYNDNVNTNNGKALGKWWISIAAAQANVVVDGAGSGSGCIGQARVQYSILSVGTVRGRAQVILRETVRQQTWAKYALWMNNNNGIYFTTGERFYGPVHSNERLNFSGNPEFFSDCTSASSTYGGSTNACTFHNGLQLGVSNQTIQTVSFSNLESKATLVLEGRTYVTFSGTNMLITNTRMGWSFQPVGTSSNGLIYIKTSTTGSTSTRPGDIYVGGVLDGRITLVAERDVYITNHIMYAVDSKTNLLSDDALGMISKRDISVTTAAPNNLQIYSHMMATGQYDPGSDTDGSFGVINYDDPPPRGRLMVHGGIVQDDRGAVGTFSGTNMVSGFFKDYTFDSRFEIDPPPDYPPLSNDLLFGPWRKRK